jgi:hypothetical protein
MDYSLIFLFWLIGVGWCVMAKVSDLKKKFPTLGFSTIWATFLKEEWDSLFTSCLVLFTMEAAWYIVTINQVKIPVWLDLWGMYAISLLLGYCGQRVAYKYFKTAESKLEEKADLINKL